MKLAITLALALGLATMTLSAPAHACGFISPEVQVRRAFIASGAGGWDAIHAVTFLADGRAQVELRWGDRGDRVIAQYHWFLRDEAWNWQPDGRSYTFTVWKDDASADARPPAPRKKHLKVAKRTPSRRAVAAR